jgi:carboxypeptidase family protein
MRIPGGLKLLTLALLTFVLAGASEVSAQGITTSAVSGVIRDSSGQPLSGVQVTIRHQATGVQTGGLSNSVGRYFVQHLQPGGPYSISVELIGYATGNEQGLRLSLGENRRLDFTMSSQAVVLDGIVVTTATNDIFSASRTGQETRISDKEIADLPTLSRNFTELASLSPLVSTQGVGASVGGANNRMNNIQIDGAVNNDVFGLASSGVPGGQANGKPISQDAIAEFQVQVAPFDVRQSGFTGGLINAVTKSGTNEFHGTVYGLFRDENLTRTDLQVGSRNFTASDFQNSSWGFTAGGPIVRDKIHFFVSAEGEKRDTPLSSGTDTDLGLSVGTVTQVQDIAENQYGLNFGRTNSYTRLNPSLNLFGRLDFQLNARNRLSIKHTYAEADFDDSPSRSQFSSFFEPESATYDFRNETNTTVAQLFSQFGDKWSNELLANFQFIRDRRAPAPEFRYSTIRVDNDQDPINDGARVQFGAERFSHANALDQDVIQITNNLTGDFGKHIITFGVNIERWSFNNLFLDRSLGQYEFDSIEDFRNGNSDFYAIRVPLLGTDLSNAAAIFSYTKVGAYVQDEIAATDNLTLTAGLRIDVPFTGDTPRTATNFQNTFGFGNTDVPSGNPLFQPRVGFNYRLDGDAGRGQLRGGVGMFAGRPPFVWMANAFGNTGQESVELRCFGGNTPAFDPNSPPTQCADGSGVGSGARGSIATVDPNFDFPQELKFDLAWDQEWGNGFRTTFEGIFSKPIDAIVVEELNATVPVGTTTTDGVGTRTTFGVPIDSKDEPFDTSLRNDSDFFEVVRMTNSSKGYGYSLVSEVEKDWNRVFNVRASYTYTKRQDLQSLTSSRAISNWGFNPAGADPRLDFRKTGTSNFETPHRIIATASASLWEQAGGTRISLIYRGQSGSPYSYVYDGDVNGDGFAGDLSSTRTNDLVYIPNSSSEIAFRSADDERMFNELVALDSCVSGQKGTIMERNSCDRPWAGALDLRVVQGVNAPNGRFEITWDIFNVMNLLKESWGINESGGFSTVQLLRTRGRENDDPNGRILFTYDGFREKDDQGVNRAILPFSVNSFASRWRMQLGVRYVF